MRDKGLAGPAQGMSVPPGVSDASDNAYVDAGISITHPRVRYMNSVNS